MKPLAIDLFAGLGGWSDGLIAEGWRVIGYDIERHEYGDQKYPGELVLQDVLTIHGSQFKDADLIVCSPPCQEFSYMAMPWSRAKAIQKDYLEGKRDRKKLTALFDACFRIQREASAAAGHYIPMVVENVCGAQKWVGRARWHHGSYYLWGDVPALMPITQKATKVSGLANGHLPPGVLAQGAIDNGLKLPGNNSPRRWDEREVKRLCDVDTSGFKSQGMNWSDQTKRGQDFTRLAGEHCKLSAVVSDSIRNGKSPAHWTNPDEHYFGPKPLGHKSGSRKAASAMIAKIPLPLARWIAKTMKPFDQTKKEGLE
jgi:hypothetical protein